MRSRNREHRRNGNPPPDIVRKPTTSNAEVSQMGRGILLWLLGVPIPVIILILLFWR
jgi:hypothetical protein